MFFTYYLYNHKKVEGCEGERRRQTFLFICFGKDFNSKTYQHSPYQVRSKLGCKIRIS